MPDVIRDHAPVIPVEQARQGEATGHVRYVLGFSLVLAIISGAALYAIYFL
jgi:hypothetical protein